MPQTGYITVWKYIVLRYGLGQECLRPELWAQSASVGGLSDAGKIDDHTMAKQMCGKSEANANGCSWASGVPVVQYNIDLSGKSLFSVSTQDLSPATLNNLFGKSWGIKSWGVALAKAYHFSPRSLFRPGLFFAQSELNPEDGTLVFFCTTLCT